MIHGKYLFYSITKSDQSFNEQPNYFKLVTVYVTVYYVDNDFDKRDTINCYSFKWIISVWYRLARFPENFRITQKVQIYGSMVINTRFILIR